MKFKFLHKLSAVILAVTISMLCFASLASATDNGICGANINWSFDETTGELLLSGSGEMYDYAEPNHVPWHSLTDKITKITVSEGIETIGRYSFAGCSNATEITLSEGLEEIKYGSFDNCSSITSITIPASVEKIDKAPFYFCLSLVSITVAEGNEDFCSDSSGVLYNKDKTALIQYPCAKNDANFSVPYTVTTINVAAFAGNSSIRNIVMAQTVHTIDSMAFYNCTALEFITIPKSVKMIGDKAFSDCTALSEVYYTGTQEEWNAVAIRNDNEKLTDRTILFESNGPETVPENEPTQSTQPESVEQTNASVVLPTEQLKDKREIIPLIIIGIAAIVLILIIVLIRVIVKKYPDEEKNKNDE